MTAAIKRSALKLSFVRRISAARSLAIASISTHRVRALTVCHLAHPALTVNPQNVRHQFVILPCHCHVNHLQQPRIQCAADCRLFFTPNCYAARQELFAYSGVNPPPRRCRQPQSRNPVRVEVLHLRVGCEDLLPLPLARCSRWRFRPPAVFGLPAQLAAGVLVWLLTASRWLYVVNYCLSCVRCVAAWIETTLVHERGQDIFGTQPMVTPVVRAETCRMVL